MRRYLVILFSLALNLSFGQASWWYGNAGGSAPAGPDTLTLTYWNDFVLLHIANTGITEDVNGVSAWQDRSGNGNHSTQTVNTNKPSTDVNGNVVFDGTNDYLDMADNFFNSDTSMTFFCVFEQITTNGFEVIMEIASDSTKFQFYSNEVATNRSISLQNRMTLGGTPYQDTTSVPVTRLFALAHGSRAGGTMRINGVEENNIDVATYGTWNPNASQDGETIGGDYLGVDFFSNIRIKFIGIANRKFTPAEIATTESELNSYFTIY